MVNNSAYRDSFFLWRRRGSFRMPGYRNCVGAGNPRLAGTPIKPLSKNPSPPWGRDQGAGGEIATQLFYERWRIMNPRYLRYGLTPVTRVPLLLSSGRTVLAAVALSTKHHSKASPVRPTRRTAILAAFAAITLGVASPASADRSPAACTTNGSSASITFVAAPGATELVHGDEICY